MGLRSIQRSDDATKKRWLIGLTTSAMLVIVGLWITYVRVSIPTITQIDKSQTNTSVSETVEKQSFTATVADGFSAVTRSAGASIASIASQVATVIGKVSRGVGTTNEFSFDVEQPHYTPNAFNGSELKTP